MAHSLLHNYEHAREALQRGLSRKPDDKELASQLVKVDERIRLEAAASTPITHNTSTASTTTITTMSSTGAPSSSSSAKNNNNKAKKDEEAEEDDEEEIKHLNVRGYKKNADGKTTTFFNNDLDEQTRALIGSIAPKKLDVQGEVITTNVPPSSGSAWNSAGTYEEKLLTGWATDFLRDLFSTLSLQVTSVAEIHPVVRLALPGLDSIRVVVSDVEHVTGDAQVTLLRGKKKHVCDYTLALKWTLTAQFAAAAAEQPTRPEIVLQGSLNVLDVSADREYEVDQIIVTHFGENLVSFYQLPSDVATLVNKYLKTSEEGFQKTIQDALNVFWDELKAK
jgi:hypothetical protein